MKFKTHKIRKELGRTIYSESKKQWEWRVPKGILGTAENLTNQYPSKWLTTCQEELLKIKSRQETFGNFFLFFKNSAIPKLNHCLKDIAIGHSHFLSDKRKGLVEQGLKVIPP